MVRQHLRRGYKARTVDKKPDQSSQRGPVGDTRLAKLLSDVRDSPVRQTEQQAALDPKR